jgi:hypothetical protein
MNNNQQWRISEQVLSETKNLDELIEKMTVLRDGRSLAGAATKEEFKLRFESFKEMLSQDLPDFTHEEILKFDRFFHRFRGMYEWIGVGTFLTALEFELRKNKE